MIATLTPVASTAADSSLCLLSCGPRASADAVANLILFVPLGFALGLAGWRPRRVAMTGAAGSLLIELAQFSLIAGRDASLADVLSNAAGAWVGALIATYIITLLAPPKNLVRPFLAGSALAAVGVVAGTGILLSPWMPDVSYHGQWSEYRGRFHAYSGRVVSAFVGSEPLPQAGAAPARLRDQMVQGKPLRVSLIVGPVRAWPSQIVRVGEGEGNILLLSASGPDLLLFYRSRSGALRLDEPVVRLAGVLRQAGRGSFLVVEATPGVQGFCLRALDQEACQTLMPGSAWQLIQNAWTYPLWMQRTANALVIALLWLPLGVWTRRDYYSLVLVASAIAATAVLPQAVGLRPMRLEDWTVAAVGWLSGAMLAAMARHADAAERWGLSRGGGTAGGSGSLRSDRARSA